ncbi:MAG TPA: hypothetical protein VM434_06860 [Beijerinckiaceae bacterium]|nr:hypothetical protein [Beijerinckiaceae bacterium]
MDVPEERRQAIRFAGREMPLPRSRGGRIALGGLLVLGGVFSILPVLGLWMLPLGLLVLSVDLALMRRHRRRLAVWWARRRGRPPGEDPSP